MAPRLSKVETFVQAAIGTDHQVILVVRVEGHRVVIDVLGVVIEHLHRLPAILGNVQAYVRVIDAVELVWARPQLVVVMRAGAAGRVLGTFRPAIATVLGTEHRAGAIREFDRGVQHVRVLRADRESGFAPNFLGEPVCQLTPGLAGILRLVDARCRPTVHEHRDIAEFLPDDGVHDVGIARVDKDLGHAGVAVVYVRIAVSVTKHLAPVLAAVGRLEKAPIAPCRP